MDNHCPEKFLSNPIFVRKASITSVHFSCQWNNSGDIFPFKPPVESLTVRCKKPEQTVGNGDYPFPYNLLIGNGPAYDARRFMVPTKIRNCNKAISYKGQFSVLCIQYTYNRFFSIREETIWCRQHHLALYITLVFLHFRQTEVATRKNRNHQWPNKPIILCVRGH